MSTKQFSAIRSKMTIVLRLGSEKINIQQKSSPELFEEVAKLIEDEKLDELQSKFGSIKERIESFSKGTFTVQEGKKVTLKGTEEEIPKALVKKLMELESEGEDFMPFLRFWRKLRQNPSKNSREQLYRFILHHKMGISETGDIVMEKGVNQKKGGYPGELVDARTARFDNSIGMIVEMDRDKVQDDPNQACSAGLHVGPPFYVRKHYNENSYVIIECLVNPKDVVSVPHDYNNSKIRVCRYQVVGYADVKNPRKQQVVKLSDFVELPTEHLLKNQKSLSKEPGYREGTESTKSTETDMSRALKEIQSLTAKQIIDHIKVKTGVDMKVSLKNKQGIIKKAIKLLIDNEESKESDKATIVIEKQMKAKDIVELAQKHFKKDIGGSSPRRARVIIKLEKLCAENNIELILE